MVKHEKSETLIENARFLLHRVRIVSTNFDTFGIGKLHSSCSNGNIPSFLSNKSTNSDKHIWNSVLFNKYSKSISFKSVEIEIISMFTHPRCMYYQEMGSQEDLYLLFYTILVQFWAFYPQRAAENVHLHN